MAKTIVPNYTADQVTLMKSMYTAVKTDEERKEVIAKIANDFDKKINSVIGKLVRMKVYIKPAKATSTTSAGKVKKIDLVSIISLSCGVEPSVMESLTKATMQPLENVTAQFKKYEDTIADLERDLQIAEQEAIDADLELS